MEKYYKTNGKWYDSDSLKKLKKKLGKENVKIEEEINENQVEGLPIEYFREKVEKELKSRISISKRLSYEYLFVSTLLFVYIIFLILKNSYAPLIGIIAWGSFLILGIRGLIREHKLKKAFIQRR